VAIDPILTRRYVTLTPDDPNDPPRFGQPTETVKDALLLTTRSFLQQENALPGLRTEEIPTFRKYAIGYGPGTNPYETFSNIVQEYPDVMERLPHVAILGATGENNPINIGRPMVSPTWYAPRITGTAPGPYVFANPQQATWTITVTSAAPGVYSYDLVSGVTVSYTAGVGDTVYTIAAGLRSATLATANLILDVTVSGAVVTLRWLEYGVAFTLTSVSAGLTAVQTVTPPVGVAGPNILSYQTEPWLPGSTPETVQSQVIFAPARFATGSIGAASAAEVVRIINEQARYAMGQAVTVGAGTGVRLYAGGKLGGRGGPNSIEILDNGSDIGGTLGLAIIETGAAGDAITGTAPTMTLTVAGADFTGSTGRYVTLTGCPTLANDGRYLITGVPTAESVEYTNAAGVAESLEDVRVFVGYRDDSSNTARLVQNRFVHSMRMTVTFSIYTESANTRTELVDLILTQWQFWLEQQFFTILGRGVQDETYANEQYVIVVHSEVTNAGDNDFPRPNGDGKDRIYEGRISVPVTLWWYLDRQVEVPSGPEAGQSWTLDPGDVDVVDATELPPSS